MEQGGGELSNAAHQQQAMHLLSSTGAVRPFEGETLAKAASKLSRTRLSTHERYRRGSGCPRQTYIRHASP